MRDIAHDETERILAKMEKEVASVYTQAQKELSEKLDDYLKRFETKDAIWQRNVADGKRTVEEYKQWKQGQMLAGYRWQAMRDQIAEDLHESNALARSIVMGYRPEVYAINHNYATYRIEKAAKVNTGYTLYSRETVEKILRDQPELLPPPTGSMQKKLRDYKKATGKDIAWQKGQLQSVMTQAVLQGESIPNISKRIANTLGEMNHKSTIRYARTAITGAQNAGRVDAYKRASGMGINLKQRWVATIDFRTRHEHRLLDGETAEVGEPFKVEGYEIMFPGDPAAEGFLIWNCRCTTIADVEGLSHDFSGRSDEAIQEMSYDDWKESRYEESHSITKQEEIVEIMKRRYINELYGGGSGGIVEEQALTATQKRADSIGQLTEPVRPRKADFADEESYLKARAEYKEERAKYVSAIESAAEATLSGSPFTTYEEFCGWAKKVGVEIGEGLEQIDARVLGYSSRIFDEMFERFPEVKSFAVEMYEGGTFNTRFRIGVSDIGLMSANTGVYFNPRYFAIDSTYANYMGGGIVRGIVDSLEQIADGFNVRGDGSFAVTIRHEYGHNVQSYIEEKISQKYHVRADNWRENFTSFSDYKEAQTKYLETRHNFEQELLSLSGLDGSSEYSNTNIHELFAEGFADWSSGGTSEFAMKFGEFLKRWY